MKICSFALLDCIRWIEESCAQFHKYLFSQPRWILNCTAQASVLRMCMVLHVQEYATKSSSKHTYNNACLLRKGFIWGINLNLNSEVVTGASHMLLIVFYKMSTGVAAGLTPLHWDCKQPFFPLLHETASCCLNSSPSSLFLTILDILFAHSNWKISYETSYPLHCWFVLVSVGQSYTNVAHFGNCLWNSDNRAMFLAIFIPVQDET